MKVQFCYVPQPRTVQKRTFIVYKKRMHKICMHQGKGTLHNSNNGPKSGYYT